MTKEATVHKFEFVTNSARLYRDQSIQAYHHMWILVEWGPFFHASFIIKNNEWLLKAKEISNLMTKETTMYKLEFAASSAWLI